MSLTLHVLSKKRRRKNERRGRGWERKISWDDREKEEWQKQKKKEKP